MMSNAVITELSEKAKQDIANYLDAEIQVCRQKVMETATERDHANNLMWRAYVDAYQSVRTSLLGETLP